MTPHPSPYLAPGDIYQFSESWPMPTGYRLVLTFDPGWGVVQIEAVCEHADEEEDEDSPYAVLPIDAVDVAGLSEALNRLLIEAIAGTTTDPLTVEEVIGMGRGKGGMN